MARQNGVPTIRLQVSLDPTTNRTLQLMIPLGLHGKNKSEVASWILREWIWHNQEVLARLGVHIRGTQPPDAEAPGNPRTP